jgi:hypothetical protein
MPLFHTCAPPKDGTAKPSSLWVCPECGAIWEAAPDTGIFDFDRSEAITRAEWLLVEEPTILAG